MKFIRIVTFLSLMPFLSSLCFSQNYLFPYYGKNKVLYGKFNWKSYSTEHFQIYFYTDNVQTLKNIAETAESAYQTISQELKYTLSSPIPLIFYKTYTDFEQTNLFSISEGVLGVSEPTLQRIGVHGDMPLDEFQTLIIHELSHIFEFEILWGSPDKSLYAVNIPPLWVFEGLAEYNTRQWSPWSTLILRDAVLCDRIPEFSDSGELVSPYLLPREPAYDFGHAIYEFIESRFGKNAVREFLFSMKNISLLAKKGLLKKAFNMKLKDFSFEFKKYLRNKFKDFYLRENPEDYSIPLGPEFPMNPYYFAFSHTLSPSGDIVATITYNLQDYKVDIVLISTKDGSIIRNITKGFTSKYEYVKAEIDPSQGKSLSWSPDGDRIAFFARDGEKYSLFIIEALKGKILKKIKVGVDQPTSPCFYPDGSQILFAGFQNGIRDIFKVDLSTEKIINLSQDSLFEKAPTISPDGKYIAYSIRIDAYDKLFLSPLDNLKKKTQLTFDKDNTICPQFSPDGKEIYFSSDLKDAYNIYSLDIETGELKRYTDVRTGNFYPTALPNEPQKVIFSSFNKSAFQIFKSEFEGVVEKKLTFAEFGAEEKFKPFMPAVTLEIQPDKILVHKGLGKLYLTSRPPIGAIVSTDGTVMGGSAISFSDILGDNYFILEAYQVRSFRTYFLSYLNQKRRFQYMASYFQYTQFYYPDYAYYDPDLWTYLTYRDAMAYRKISSVNFSGYYPLNRYYRVEASLGYYRYEEEFLDPNMIGFYSNDQYNYFVQGRMLQANFSLVGETTHFDPLYGPKSGNTFRLSISPSLPIFSGFLQNTTLEADYRQYIYLGSNVLLALRWNGFLCRGKNPFVFFYGGDNQVRSSYYNNIIATEAWFANIEFRFPLLSFAYSILGQIGPVRGVIFFDITRAKLNGFPAKFNSYLGRNSGLPEFRTDDAIGSFGYGIEFFLLGLPLHLEFAKRLCFPDISNPFNFDAIGKFETKFWIGFDF